MAKNIPEDKILLRIKTFCWEKPMSLTSFGKKCLKDPNLVRDLTEGRELRGSTRARIEKYIVKHEPKAISA